MNFFLKAKTISLIFFVFQIFLLISAQKSWSQNKVYHIGPRDILTLKIYAGGEKQQEVDLTVSAKGMINAPFIGPVKAKGLSISQLEASLIKPLAEDYFVNPQVNINIKEYHNLQYYTSGAFKKPGLYEMTSEPTLMELIAKAGGVLPERGNRAYILRSCTENIAKGQDIENLLSSKKPIKVDLNRLLDRGDMSLNLVLQSGDVVYIPLERSLDLAESKVYVEGEVRRPGIYHYQPGLTAMNACIMAGGFDKFAAPNRTMIIRRTEGKQETIKINLNKVREGKIPDIALKPGDRIHVPETWL